jgi:hypothetical protein
VHNQINPALATSTTLHIDSRNGVISECKEINRLSGLGVRDDPNLEVTPQWFRSEFRAAIAYIRSGSAAIVIFPTK